MVNDGTRELLRSLPSWERGTLEDTVPDLLALLNYTWQETWKVAPTLATYAATPVFRDGGKVLP